MSDGHFKSYTFDSGPCSSKEKAEEGFLQFIMEVMKMGDIIIVRHKPEILFIHDMEHGPTWRGMAQLSVDTRPLVKQDPKV